MQPSLHEELLQQELRPLRHSSRPSNKYVWTSSLLMVPAAEYSADERETGGHVSSAAMTDRGRGLLYVQVLQLSRLQLPQGALMWHRPRTTHAPSRRRLANATWHS